MGLGISKDRPKYTPPKVCKKVKKVPSPPWGVIDCPTVPQLTMRVTWPQEPGALTKDAQLVYKLDKVAPCTWVQSNGFVPGAHGVATLFVQFQPFGPFLDVQIGYQWDPGHFYNYTRLFADYNAHQAKLLIPSPIPPDAGSLALRTAMVFLST